MEIKSYGYAFFMWVLLDAHVGLGMSVSWRWSKRHFETVVVAQLAKLAPKKISSLHEAAVKAFIVFV